jgi:hypothetical protein
MAISFYKNKPYHGRHWYTDYCFFYQFQRLGIRPDYPYAGMIKFVSEKQKGYGTNFQI